jgi:ribosomal protein L31E
MKNQTNDLPEISIKVIWILMKKIIILFKSNTIEVCPVRMLEVVATLMKYLWKSKIASKTLKKECTPMLAMMIWKKNIKKIFSRVKVKVNLELQRKRTTEYWYQVKRRWRITWKISTTRIKIIGRII